MRLRPQRQGIAAIALSFALLAGCATTPSVASTAGEAGARPAGSPTQYAEFPETFPSSPQADVDDYRLGAGDVLEIDVFGASELGRTVRVRPDGSLSLPLLGRLEVSGQSTAQLEQALESALGARYLRNPDVTIFVKEYRAHPVTVLGEVKEPGVFYLRQRRTVVEMLSEAGGVTEEAGDVVHVRRKVNGPQADAGGFELLTVELHEHLSNGDSGPDLPVADEDTIYVPKGGVVYVEGAVVNPGVYPLRGGGSVLKAVTMAGGLAFRASPSKVQLIRKRGAAPVRLDLDDIDAAPQTDVRVQDGDIVMVGSNPLKVGLWGLWRGVSGLFAVTAGF